MNNKDLRLATFLLFVATLVLAALLANVLLSDPHVAMRQEGFLEEIIVTTQKREQSVQKVPIAVSVVNSAKLNYPRRFV
jgi:outer membrane receptor protein involved in Fe transport